jgi:hypothetical protein
MACIPSDGTEAYLGPKCHPGDATKL